MDPITGAAVRDTWRQLDAETRTFQQILESSGMRPIRSRRSDPHYLSSLAEAATFLAEVLDGRRPAHALQEAMSTSDFPLLMGDILDRQMLSRYAEYQPTWQNYARRGTVRDFRQARRIAVDGLEGSYYPDFAKPELTSPKEEALTETGYLTQVQVYEKAVALNWRMLVNDDLDAFSSIPDRLARGARRTEERFATALYVDSTGPHGSVFTSGNANIVTGNPALSIGGLQTAMTVLAAQTDASGEPIVVEAMELVVPPALEITALNILNAEMLDLTTAGGAVSGQGLRTRNWMKGRLRLSVNPYIPIIANSSNGDTSWFLFANPAVGRPFMEVTFLRGYEQPGIYQKAPNTMRVGGGVEATLGDFDTNEIRYKGMHVIGGVVLDPRAGVGSEGDGS